MNLRRSRPRERMQRPPVAHARSRFRPKGPKAWEADWASPSSPDTFNDMMCSGESDDEDEKELHGRIQT